MSFIRGRLLVIFILTFAVILVASHFTNDGGANKHFTDEEVAAKREEVEKDIKDDRLCHMHYRLCPSLFAKLHNKFLGVVEESVKLPLYFQVAIYLDYVAHATTFREQLTHFKVSMPLISRARNNIRNAVMLIVYPEFACPQMVDDRGAARGMNEADLDRKGWEKFRHFEGCVGSIDGCHIKISADAQSNTTFFSTRKKAVTTNVQFVATVNKSLMITHAFVGIEGRASDSQSMQLRAFAQDLQNTFGDWVRGKFLIGDAGYALSFKLLTPYRGVMYHLREFDVRNDNNENAHFVRDKYELFNLRHAMFRNEVERAFGVLKKRFKILVNGIAGYTLSDTWDTIYSCIAIHNFIRHNISAGVCGPQAREDAFILRDVDQMADDDEAAIAAARLATEEDAQDRPEEGAHDRPEDNANDQHLEALPTTASEWRDQIAIKMWADYSSNI